MWGENGRTIFYVRFSGTNYVWMFETCIINVYTFKDKDVVKLYQEGHEWVEVEWIWFGVSMWLILIPSVEVMGSCGSITTCPSMLLPQIFFLVPHAYEKKEKNIALHTCLLRVGMTYVIYNVDAISALGYTCVMCDWFYPYLWYLMMWNWFGDWFYTMNYLNFLWGPYKIYFSKKKIIWNSLEICLYYTWCLSIFKS